MRVIVALVAAILVPSAIVVADYVHGQFAMFEPSDPYIWIRSRNFATLCILITAAHVLILGLPTFLILRSRGLVRWWTTILCGFALGALPLGVITWPLRYAQSGSSAWSDGVATMIDGVVTAAGWTQFLSAVSVFGALGAISAGAFWAIIALSPNNLFKPTPLRGVGKAS